ncbi:ABC transporter ATP-binding protein [Halomicroarcula sp. GCM10025817]|uniref:ABC transporter ATP-binding protein n=1 Tax=Haloarcula TaxID=2237 RepID=UPI0023E80D5A|nr:ABC transporter ATP-binding protein [Halomicroarcula sp. SYNS111]
MAQSSEPSVQEAEQAGEAIASESGGQQIVLSNVRKTFGGGSIVAAEDINLDISPDEFVVLLGPSGCGKTTTLRCISGLETPDQGTIKIGDKDVTSTKPKDRNLAFVFQSIALFPHMSVRENIRFGLDMKTDLSTDEKNRRVQEAAETLGIAEMLDRKPAALSGGQQQRVSIGRAMVMEPAAFLLDEPFSALDANLRDQMQTEVKKLQRQIGCAMIFVTHDQDEAMTIGDKIIVMDDGHIQQIGSPHEIYNEPESQFVAQFIGSPSTNIFESTLVDHGDGIALESDLFTKEIPADIADDLSTYVGHDVTIGIRPEYLRLNDETLFEADISVIEPQGARDVVHLETSGHAYRTTVMQGEIEPNQSVSVSFDMDDVWLFDEDGERIF